MSRIEEDWAGLRSRIEEDWAGLRSRIEEQDWGAGLRRSSWWKRWRHLKFSDQQLTYRGSGSGEDAETQNTTHSSHSPHLGELILLLLFWPFAWENFSSPHLGGRPILTFGWPGLCSSQGVPVHPPTPPPNFFFLGHIDVCAFWHLIMVKYSLNINENLQYKFWKGIARLVFKLDL